MNLQTCSQADWIFCASSWLSQWNFRRSIWPSQFTRAFCYVVEDWSLLRCIVERAGFHLINDEEADILELGRQLARRKRADEAISLLEAKLREAKL